MISLKPLCPQRVSDDEPHRVDGGPVPPDKGLVLWDKLQPSIGQLLTNTLE